MARTVKPHREPLLEWVSAAAGLALTLGVLGLIGREALSGDAAQPPSIEVVPVRIAPAGPGFVVEVAAINRSGGTAAEVEVEGMLMRGESELETSRLIFDYVPGHAERRGGMYFREDPRRHRLELRPLGYQRP
jgi:uncharacterized protein (TIGR02588 family)